MKKAILTKSPKKMVLTPKKKIKLTPKPKTTPKKAKITA